MERQSSLSFQAGIRNNAEEINSALRDFSTWTEEMKEYDVRIRKDTKDTGPQKEMNETNHQIPESDESTKEAEERTVPGAKENKQAKPSIEQVVDEERSRANRLYSSGKYSEAIKVYTRCLQFNPKSALIYSNRGEVCILLLQLYIAFLSAQQNLMPKP